MDLYAPDVEVCAPGVYAGSTGSRRPNGGLVGAATGLGIGLGLAYALGLFNEEATDETPSDIPTIPEQAAELAKEIGKSTVNVPTEDGVRHYDLGGAEHKGVPTPHVQESKINVSPTGTHLNKDRSRKGVREMTQKDIDDVKDFLGLK